MNYLHSKLLVLYRVSLHKNADTGWCEPGHDLVDQDGCQLLWPHEGAHQLLLTDHAILKIKHFSTFLFYWILPDQCPSQSSIGLQTKIRKLTSTFLFLFLTLSGVVRLPSLSSGTRWNRWSTILFNSSMETNPLWSESNILKIHILGGGRIGSYAHLKICLSLDSGVPSLMTETITRNSWNLWYYSISTSYYPITLNSIVPLLSTSYILNMSSSNSAWK